MTQRQWLPREIQESLITRLKINGYSRDRGQLCKEHRGLHTEIVDTRCPPTHLMEQTQNMPIEDTSWRKMFRNLNDGKTLTEI